MNTGRRLVSLVFASLVAAVVWIIARWLWPYLELVAPVGALIVLLLAVNVIDGVWFAVRNRRRLAVVGSAAQRQGKSGDTSTSRPAVGLSGTR